MTALPPPTDSWLLPALAPDLVVRVADDGEPRIVRIAPGLARLAACTPEEAHGRRLDRLFPAALPNLTELVREALAQEQAFRDIHLRLTGSGKVVAVDIEPGGLSDDYRGHLVSLRFRPAATLPTATAQPVSGLLGQSTAMGEVWRKIGLYAPTEAPVIITGETGSGKELAARALHDGSPRSRGTYVALNCAALSEELLESELFGHEKGAFTGALRSHRGRFERADGGTLFLDEIGDMPLHTQTRLLRVLETGRIERVGAEAETHVDVRVVAATHVPLEHAVAQGRFRADLYHRLAVLRVHLPPLRHRSDDIPLLAEHFLHLFSRKYGRAVQRLTPEALKLLQSYLWPGNVRELRNVLERVFVESQAEVIGARAFAEWVRERQDFAPGGWQPHPHAQPTIAPPYPLPPARALGPAPSQHSTRSAELDPAEIKGALAATDGNLTAAARLLGVHRATLYRYLSKLGLSRAGLDQQSTEP